MNTQNLISPCSSRETRNNTTSNSNYIYDTLRNIDRMQREASNITGCVTCNDLLVNNTIVYNTKPIRCTLCSGIDYQAYIGVNGTLTNYFRVQEIRGNSVVLRLLQYSTDTSTFSCTNFTTVLDIKCICAIQCFPAINCGCCANELI